VRLDLSGVALEAKIDEAVRRLGAGKLIWGTDGPYAHPDLVGFARGELEKIRRLPIGQAEKEEISSRGWRGSRTSSRRRPCSTRQVEGRVLRPWLRLDPPHLLVPMILPAISAARSDTRRDAGLRGDESPCGWS
jgi:hypothetical protein